MPAKKRMPGAKAPSVQTQDSASLRSADLARTWKGRVGPEGAGRADRWVAEVAGILSRSQIKARDASFYMGGKEIKPSRPLRPGDELEVRWTDEPASDLVPEDIPLRIIYEDARVMVIDKPQGMVTHPGHGNRRGTLANAALFRNRTRAGATTDPDPAQPDPVPARVAPARGGIVHRLDKDTSGIIIVARDAEAQEFLAAQFRDRAVRKEYLAITRGIPPRPEGCIRNRLARDPRNRKRFASLPSGDAASRGKSAWTEYRVLASWSSGGSGYALVALYPKTGRTHQLRVHMAELGCPILGDPIYGKKDAAFPEATLHLHARRLRIRLPGHDAPTMFGAPLPERFRAGIAALDQRFGRARPDRGPPAEASRK